MYWGWDSLLKPSFFKKCNSFNVARWSVLLSKKRNRNEILTKLCCFCSSCTAQTPNGECEFCLMKFSLWSCVYCAVWFCKTPVPNSRICYVSLLSPCLWKTLGHFLEEKISSAVSNIKPVICKSVSSSSAWSVQPTVKMYVRNIPRPKNMLEHSWR